MNRMNESAKFLVSAASAAYLLALAINPAPAAEVDLATVIRNQDGEPFTDCRKWDQSKSPSFCEREVQQTVGAMIVAALNTPEQGLGYDEQVRRGLLALRVSGAKSIDFGVDDLKLVKDLLAKRGYIPIALVRAMEVLDPASLKK